jgi:hypothetical protein
VIDIQEALFEAVQLHATPVATFVPAVPPPAPNDWPAGEMV